MDKTYDPKIIEHKWYETWENAGYFQASGRGKPFCLMIPPPNVTGSLHMGHALEASLMDCLVRYHRMLGENTHWQVGTDHAGIATQMVVERELSQENLSRHDLGREQFEKRIWQWKEQSGNTITNQLRRMGASTDWTRERFTMDPGLSKAVREVFIRLFDEGLIYRKKRLVNWDPHFKTAISDLEVASAEEDSFLWHLRYPLKDDPTQYIIVATTRPETLFGDQAVVVNPDDSRYQHLIGKEVELPLTGRTIPIIADETVIAEFGSGAVKVTPAHDFNDYARGQKFNLTPLNIFTLEAHLNQNVPTQYQGMERFVARKQLIADLETIGLVEKIEPYKRMIERGDRSNVIIEPMLTDQWYVNIKPLADEASKAVRSGDMQFVPKNWENTFFAWMDNIQDWCISRQLWWGHRIPAWYDDKGNIYVAEDEITVREKYNIAKDIALHQDEDVLDTWFSSALWPFSTLGWPEKTPEMDVFYPTTVLITGFDIIFFWVARMMMMGLKFTGQVPFKEVYIHGLITDQDGQKMSKSKGNVIDPIDLIDGIDLESLVKKRTANMLLTKQAQKTEKQTRQQFPNGIPAFGTDAVRFTFCAQASTGRHIQFDLNRFEGYRNFCNKLWNAARFVLMNTEGLITSDKPKNLPQSLPDRYILTQLSLTIANVKQHLSQYRFDLAAQACYEFVWHEYCDWYLELTRSLLKDENEDVQLATRYTLLEVLETSLRLLHPFIPYMSEEIWQRVAPMLGITTKSIMVARYPDANDFTVDNDSVKTLTFVKNIITGLRNMRGEMNIPPRKPIEILIKQASVEDKQIFQAQENLLKELGFIDNITWLENETLTTACATVISGQMEILVPLAGLIDKQAEISRLERLLVKTQKEYDKLAQKLNNPHYCAHQSEEGLAEEKLKLLELQHTIENTKASIAAMTNI
ncbi:MAG: valine--tRNA ligase [Legionellales bacterium]|jgi:valyl-tRNA synthetase